MKLYYCFNGLNDYEFEVDVAEIIDAFYKIFNIIVIEEAVDFYFKNYNEMLTQFFIKIAYWDYLCDEKMDFLDEKLMKKYRRAIREEDKMLYGKIFN